MLMSSGERRAERTSKSSGIPKEGKKWYKEELRNEEVM
jgi:hypothetical protein